MFRIGTQVGKGSRHLLFFNNYVKLVNIMSYIVAEELALKQNNVSELTRDNCTLSIRRQGLLQNSCSLNSRERSLWKVTRKTFVA